MDLRLAEMMKAKLHILIGLNEHGNNNSRNGLNFIPSNQLVLLKGLSYFVEVLLGEHVGVCDIVGRVREERCKVEG